MPTVNQILALAKSQIGTTEYPPNSNCVIYNDAFYGHSVKDGTPKGATYPWCATFVWWVFNQFTPCLVKKTASCMNMGDWFKANGRWGATPHVGDVVFFKFNTNSRWTNHVGIVKEVLDGGAKLITIEGNTSEKGSQDNGGAVLEKTRTSNIVGFGRPAYTESTPVDPDGNYEYGVDVSECQGKIAWDKVKADGISFACLRSTKKNGSVDKTFEDNLKGCIDNHIDYSCYKYAYAKTHEEARIEADGVINLLKDRKCLFGMT